MKRTKEPTWVHLVETALRTHSEDFLSIPMLCKLTNGSYKQVDAALWHLRVHRVCDVVVETDGRGWWFALPVELDTRQRHVVQRAPEAKKRKPRRAKPAKQVHKDA